MPAFIDQLPLLPSASQMHEWDRNAIQFGIPEMMLMENAGQALFNFINDRFFPLHDKKFLLFMGGGNNGGDAACLARCLQDAGATTLVICAKNPDDLPETAARHFRLAKEDGVEFLRLTEESPDLNLLCSLCEKFLRGVPDLAIDGLLGTGFHGELKSALAKLVHAINNFTSFMRLPMLAIDAPSGLDCDTGQPSPVAIIADWTICLASAKKGQLQPHARRWTGEIVERKIGIPQASAKPASMRLLDGRILLQKQSFPRNGFKNSYGHVLVIGGSPGLTGAPHLAALAALRSGAGLASVCAPGVLGNEIKTGNPEIMLLPAGMADAAQWPDKPDEALLNKIVSMQALVIGPGMGQSESAACFLQAVLELPKRPAAVIDADALRLLAEHRHLLSLLRENDILTPHPGEASALLDTSGKFIQDDRTCSLWLLCRLAPSCFILKGAGTLIGKKDEISLLAPYDLPQMSIAGAGDVLSGCLGALIARKDSKSPMEIAAIGVIRHLIAGMICAQKFPSRGALASDLANALVETSQFIEKCDISALKEGALPWPY